VEGWEEGCQDSSDGSKGSGVGVDSGGVTKTNHGVLNCYVGSEADQFHDA
jgi:hypothetical protein